MVRGIASAALGILIAGAGCAPAPRTGTGAAAPALPDSLDVVLLFEEHRIQDAVDTLVTWVAPGRVRVSHRGGDAILDIERDRFVLLDPDRRSYRESSLVEWERRIRDAALMARAAADSAAGNAHGVDSALTLRFAPAGSGDRVAGFTTERFHLFAERPLFPGEWEQLEQEIWMTTAIDLPAPAMAAYRRMFATLDWIDFDARVERPAGVRVRLVSRRRPHAAADAATETEITDVVRIERRRVPITVFDAPPGWEREPSSRE